MSTQQDIAFVLHGLAWRETSLIIEVMTRHHGRLGLVARGARRPRSALRGLLQPFQPLDLRWSGQSELRNLVAAEWQGGFVPLQGAALMPGFYLNELMLRLLPREDAHPALFDDYLQTMKLLGARADQDSSDATEPILRRFEAILLRELGVAPDFTIDACDDTQVSTHRHYQVSPVSGVRRMTHPSDPASIDGRAFDAGVIRDIHGRTLLALAQASGPIEQVLQALSEPEVASQSKRLLRELLGHHLGETILQSRQIMRDLLRIEYHHQESVPT